jgi:hypothetical protein
MRVERSLANYRNARRQIVDANEGRTWISVPALLPDAPKGVWERVSTWLGTTESPCLVLSHLHCELVLDRDSSVLGEPPLTLDGFLGSSGHPMHPGLLVPGIALWLQSNREIESAAMEFVHTVELWKSLTRRPYSTPAGHLFRPDNLEPFLARGRVPRRGLVNAFVTETVARLELHRQRRPKSE